jgi:hypothetical protein
MSRMHAGQLQVGTVFCRSRLAWTGFGDAKTGTVRLGIRCAFAHHYQECVARELVPPIPRNYEDG